MKLVVWAALALAVPAASAQHVHPSPSPEPTSVPAPAASTGETAPWRDAPPPTLFQSDMAAMTGMTAGASRRGDGAQHRH